MGLCLSTNNKRPRRTINKNGNDPDLCLNKIEKFETNFAVVGVGTLRNLQIASELANNLTIKPAIFIVDIDELVIKFWKKIQKVFKASNSISEFDNKIGSLKKYTYIGEQIVPEEIDARAFSSDDIFTLFNKLFNNNEGKFHWIKDLIENRLSLYYESWCDEEVINSIKLKCSENDLKIVAYISNTLEYIQDDDEWCLAFEKNLKTLDPDVQISTDGAAIYHNDHPHLAIPRLVYHKLKNFDPKLVLNVNDLQNYSYPDPLYYQQSDVHIANEIGLIN
ncbi:hypothetical protein L3V79_05340 [Thiotrichales bacterium 19S9-12]|nr:hypothetical protein [Thiotrichales bacterium 19S9-11]MCF6811782.1 hypothetical protein [Thiotrichales bacterium 19S9-12]